MLFAPFILFLAASVASIAVWTPNSAFEPGSEIPSKDDLSGCVDTAARLLSIDMNAMTDPTLLDDILENDMHLADLLDVRRLIGDALRQEQPLGPMMNQIREGITVVHPALGVTLCAALSDKSTVDIFSAPNTAIIKRTIHHMFLLDMIVAKLADDRVFMKKVHKFVQDTVHSISPHKSFLGHKYDLFKAAGMFGVVKSDTIDGAVNDYEKFRDNGVITPEESNERKRGLTLNVLEATTSDFLHGYLSNARVGHVLAWWHPSIIEVVGENRTVAYVNDMDYARLYETWNFAFITGNLEFHNIIYPKLLIPTVLLADGNSYLYKRVLALWISINFYLIASLTGKEHVTIPNKAALAGLWGQINLKYSKFLKANHKEEL